MYTYKRFKTSKSMVKASLLLLAAALVAGIMWIGCGDEGDALAPESDPLSPDGLVSLAPGGIPGPPDDGDGGKETATFRLTYSEDSALAFANGTVTVTAEISPGTKGMNVFPSRPNEKSHALCMPFLTPCFTDDGLVGDTYTFMMVIQDKSDPSMASLQVWFDALGNDGESIVQYTFWTRGEIIGDWFPNEGESTVITGSTDDYWEMKVNKGKDRSVACEWVPTGFDWELIIERQTTGGEHPSDLK